jgi:PAS domain S-box-containing protein
MSRKTKREASPSSPSSSRARGGDTARSDGRTTHDSSFYEAVLGSIGEAVYVRDLGRKLIYMNRAAERMTGWSVGDALARPCYAVFGDEGARCNKLCPVDRAIELRDSVEYPQGSVIRIDGKSVAVRASISPFHEGGAIAGAVVVLKDMSELREQEKTNVRNLMVLERTRRELSKQVAELKAARQEVARERARLVDAIESLSEGFALFDADDRLALTNRRFLELYAPLAHLYRPGTPYKDIIRGLAESGLIGVARERREEWIAERIARRKNPGAPIERQIGADRWLLINERLTSDGGVVATYTDVTQTKRAEQALRKSEQRFRDFAEVGSDWFWETDAEHRFTYISRHDDPVIDALNRLSIGNTRVDLGPPRDMDQETWRAHIADIEARRPFRNFEYPRQASDGSTRFVRVSGKPLFTDDGSFVGYRGTATDITEQVAADQALKRLNDELEQCVEERTRALAQELDQRKRTERELSQKSTLLEATFESISEGFALFDKDDRLVFCNAIYRRLAGPLARLMEPGMRFEDMVRAACESGRFDYGEDDLETRVRARMAHHRDPQGNLELRANTGEWVLIVERKTADGGIALVQTDITDIKQAEEERRLAQARLIDAIECLPASFVLFDKDGRLVLANRLVKDYFPPITDMLTPGASFAALSRRVIESGWIVDAKGREEEYLREYLARDRRSPVQFEARLADGRALQFIEQKTSDGGMVGMRIDITERKSTENALVAAKESADVASRAKSDFLSRMSHELRTPLNAITLYTQMLIEDADAAGAEQNASDLRKVDSSAHHLLELINEVLDISKIEAGTLGIDARELDLGKLLAGCIDLVRPLAKNRGITIENLTPKSGEPRVWADETRLRQVILNVLSNAVKYNRDNGAVTIEAALQRPDTVRVTV